MADMRRKYLRPYEGPTYGYEIARASRNFFDKMFGKKTYQREKYETYQETYMSSNIMVFIVKHLKLKFVLTVVECLIMNFL